MKIIKRIKSPDHLTDVCVSDFFRNRTSGLGITWALTLIKKFRIKTVNYGKIDEKEKLISLPIEDIYSYTQKGFSHKFNEEGALIISVVGVYDNKSVFVVNISLDRFEISFSYKEKDTAHITEFQNYVTAIIKSVFNIFQETNSYSFGSKDVTVYTCPLFKTKEDGLRITSLLPISDGAILLWNTFYMPGLTPKDKMYGKYTDKKKRTPEEIIRQFSNVPLEKSCVSLRWMGNNVMIFCHYDDYTIHIAWDKKLHGKIKDFVGTFSSLLYESYFS